ncbi:acyl transferase/acyl hydrolase/lysophospholipase [Flagelloscypha sp. PMI_526]|nr:acyl transferase/acyl hydrolase/lysophospholipase [Flagelloscypha sp. PMI_526]
MHRLNVDVSNDESCHHWLNKLNKDPINPQIRPHEVFDLIGGSGTGGLIAGLLGSMKLSVEKAMTEYLAIATLLFPVEKANNTVKLEEALKTLTSKDNGEKRSMIDSRNPPVQPSGNSFILGHVSVNVRGTIPVKFRTYRAKESLVDCEVWEALRATTADLDSFDDFFIGGEQYWGTSIGNGNPTQHLCDELRLVYPDKRADLVLSLGCGHPKTISLPKKNVNSAVDMYNTLLDLRKDCEKTNDAVFLHWSQQCPDSREASPYHRLSVDQGMQNMADLALNPTTGGTVVTHTKQYLRGYQQIRRVDAIVKILHGKIQQKSLAITSGQAPKIPCAPSPPVMTLMPSKRVLSLDGGGLFGLAEMLLLRDILGGDDQRPCEYFDLIAGSGTGGIFAILLGRFELTIRQARTVFELLFKPLAGQIRDGKTEDTQALTSAFSKEVLATIFAIEESKSTGSEQPRQSPMDVTMVPKEPLKCSTFVLCNALANMNAGRPRFLGTYRSLNCRDNVSVHDAILATTSGRSLFEDVTIQFSPLIYEVLGGTSYANNNPTYHLIEEAKRLWRGHAHPFVVSVGAGQVQQINLPGSYPKKTKEFFLALQEISSDCERTHEKLLRSIDPEFYHRFNVIQGLGNEGGGQWSFASLAETMQSDTVNMSALEQSRLDEIKTRLDAMLAEEVKAMSPESVAKKLRSLPAQPKTSSATPLSKQSVIS